MQDPETLNTDVVVLGSGGAGLRAAIEAANHGTEVVVLTKGGMPSSGATIVAGAGIDIDSANANKLLGLPGDSRDSPELFFQDIVREGRFINDQRLVEVHVQEAPSRVREVVEWGLPITGLMPSPGHTYPREVYTSGVAMMHTLMKKARESSVTVYQHVMTIEIITVDGEAVGVLALDLPSGKFLLVKARAVILATGGGMFIYPNLTAPRELTGDGYAMAWRAGATLMDMEMTQFLPCTFHLDPMWKGLAYPFMLGPMGGLDVWLLNKYGNRFMLQVDPERAERSTRDLLCYGIMNEIYHGRGSENGTVWMSLAHLPKNLISNLATWHAKPNLTEDWRYKGFNFSDLMQRVIQGEAIEVSVASHFFMGGVQIDTQAQTSVPGLFAAGEVTAGLHGANRLSGNAYTEMLVEGVWAGRSASKRATSMRSPQPEVPSDVLRSYIDDALRPLARDTKEPVSPIEVRKTIQELAWAHAAVIRTKEGLRKLLREIETLRSSIRNFQCRDSTPNYNKEWIESLQTKNLLMILEAIARSALAREESRGAHNRTDFPKPNNASWLRNVIIDNRNDCMSVSTRKAVMTSFTPEGEHT